MNLIDKAAMWWMRKSVNIAQAFKVLRGQAGAKNTAIMPYRQVDVVFACVEKLLFTIVSRNVPLVLSTADEEIVEGGPVYDRLFRNPKISFDRFASDWLGNYILFRDVFIYFENPIAANSPYEIIGGPRMSEQLDYASGDVRRWQWTDDAGRLCYATPQQVRQTRNFNPYNRYHGTGPLSACDNAIQYCYSLILRNASAMRNGAEPGVILEAPVGANLKDEQIRAILANFDSRYGGPEKTMSTALLTGGMTAKTLALKMVDLQASQIDQAQACRIAASFNVPPQLVGLITEAQYSGGPAMRDFIFNSAMPLSALFSGVITETMCQGYPTEQRRSSYKSSKFFGGKSKSLMHNKSYRAARQKALQDGRDVFAWFDWSQHPVVQEAAMEWTTKVLDYTNKGVPLNNIIEAHDLPYEQQPWGNDVLVSMGLVPARWIVNGDLKPEGQSQPEGESDESDKPEKQLIQDIAKSVADLHVLESQKAEEDKRTRIWKKWAASWQVIEREYTEAIRGFFREQRKELIEKLKAVMNESKSVKADAGQVVARVVFDLAKANGRLKVINRVFFEKASKLGAIQALTETAGLEGDAIRDAVARTQLSGSVRLALEVSSTKITKVNQTTRNWVSNQLREGLEKGESLTDLTNRLADGSAFSRTRAGGIARTQTAGAVSCGRYAGMKEAGVEKKGWLTSRDDAVRPEHKAAEGRYKNGIPMDQPFIVGGDRLMFPGDPAGSAGMIANCRCMQIAVLAGGKVYDLDYYDSIKIISYDEVKSFLSEV